MLRPLGWRGPVGLPEIYGPGRQTLAKLSTEDLSCRQVFPFSIKEIVRTQPGLLYRFVFAPDVLTR